MNADLKIDESGAVPDPVFSGPVHLDSPLTESPTTNPDRTVVSVLLELQAKYGSFGKDSTGHGYRFLSLGKMLDQLRPDLTKHQCLLMSSSRMEGSVFIVKSTLMHIPSGTEISVDYPVPFAEQKANSNAQVTGGYETYGRRYNLMKMLNCTTEDDDAADIWREAVADIEEAKSKHQARIIISGYKQKFVAMNKRAVWIELGEYCKDHILGDLPEKTAEELAAEEVSNANPVSE